MFKKEKECALTPTEIEETARTYLQQMTLKEKVWLLNGNFDPLYHLLRYNNFYNPRPIATNGLKRLGISPVKFTDGPRGVVMGHATCFPVSMARGAAFDRELERKIGDVIGKEARAQGANYFGGVCVNLLRHPAWGRAQETYGEDPFHVGELGKALTEGVQAHNVMACVKHYAVNNIENSRFFVDVQADERTMHEVYLPHFKKIIDAGAASVMGAYNRFNGDHACESRWLLTQVLRDDWGFEGFTISDFIFGVRDTKKAIEAGLDVEMPTPVHYQKKLFTAVQNNQVTAETVDLAVLRLLRTIICFENTPDPLTYHDGLVAHADHVQLAQEAAEKSMVLLKNEGEVLPFTKPVKKILVLGKLAALENTGDHGSSRVYAPYVVTPLAGLKKVLGPSVEILHCDESQGAAAQKLAAAVDAVIIVAGNDYRDEGEFLTPSEDRDLSPLTEGYRNMGKPLHAILLKLFTRLKLTGPISTGMGGDRPSLSLKAKQSDLIKQVAGINPNTVVCLVCGSMIMIDEWAADIPAIVYSWYAGMAGGTALARLLFGDVNPSGRLPFTIPQDVNDLPYFSSTDKEITYDLYHGYTLLDKNNVRPAYPFGFGLSYTTFAYSDLQVTKDNQKLTVTVTLANTGSRAGAEVVQVYVGLENSSIERQRKLLKGFAKVALGAGESTAVTIPIPLAELRTYNPHQKVWQLEPGTYTIFVGPHADESKLLRTEIVINS